ncbi:MAG TPA: alpha-2-macroglobulin family protein [Pyrinomonadaceae bacterium]|nr:alpha-2-macroglobulin family protein [Pyrinomonadaceae bacterium]
MVPLRRLISSVLMFSLLPSVFHGPQPPVARADEATDQPTGLQFRLSHGVEQPQTRPATKLATATELSQSETENILRRLPPMTIDASDSQEFALRDRSLPPPRTGNTIETSFPAPAADANQPVTSGPLEVLRYSPEGSVPIAPELSVTFSQPMIALTSQDEAATNVPVKLTPQPPGKWRWLGTKTLIFDPQDRFPMATTYRVTVPSGTRSANGSTLSNEKSWSFTTPPLTVKASYPSKDNNQPRDAVMFIEFDQRIDPAAVLKAIRVTSGGRILKTRLATSDEVKQAISRDQEGSAPLRQAVNDRWLAFRAIDPNTGQTDLALPPDSRITVSVASGASSAEGPNPTQKSHDFWFSTHGPLKVTEHGCNGESRCNTYSSFEIEFSNPLVEDIDASKIRVEPALHEMETEVYGSILTIKGLKRGDTTYRVTLDKSIKDQFNQTLDRDHTFTFRVGPNPRRFVGPDDEFNVMDPAAPTRCSVFSVNYTNLKVRIYSVTPEDWPKWVAYNVNKRENAKLTPPGRLVHSRTIPIRIVPNEIVETVIDLSPALTNGHGQMILIVEPSGGPSVDEEDDFTESWIQVTDIGLDAFVDRTDLVGWVTSLKDGSPLSNVDVTLLPTGGSAQSGSDGLARLALKSSPDDGPSLIVARRDGDVAILPEGFPYWTYRAGNWRKKEDPDSLRWFVFDDRKVYQPGEEVHIKGWIRRIGASKTGDIGPLANAATQVSYVLNDSRGNHVKTGSVPLNALGGFDWKVKLPDNLNLGPATLKLQAVSSLTENTHTHTFQIQEFRRPEFEVKTQTESEGPFFVGDGADVSLSATYYAGGGLADAPVTWNVDTAEAEFTPPNRDDYVFGDSYAPSALQTLNGVTDASGKHRLHIDFDRVNPAGPTTVTASASVSDVNRQQWSSRTTLLVHPANLYVGLKTDKAFVQLDQPLSVQAIVTDLDGKLVEGREIKMVAARLSWRKEKGEWTEYETDAQECVIRSAASAVPCTFKPKEGGEYRVKATIRDDRERRNESEFTMWVSGARSPLRPDEEEGYVQLIADRKDYKAGDTAEILVQAPFYPAEGVLSVRRSGLVKVERFRMDHATTTLRVKIEEGWTPNVHVQVDLLGEEERDPTSSVKALPKKPAYASGSLKLSIPPFDRRLSVSARPRDKALEPGGETNVSVEVKDATGAPLSGGEVAVVVVDEAVLALTNYKIDDPVSAFYVDRSEEVEDVRMRGKVWLSTARVIGGGDFNAGGGGTAGRPDLPLAIREGLMAGEYPAPPPNMMAMDMSSAGVDAVRLRQDFNALAVFAPSVPTDVNGRAEVKVKLPDNLTRYRVMAVAVGGGKQFGSGESSITARKPLMVRASAPRFLNFGDAFEFPVVVQNQTDSPMSVDVTMRASNVRLSGSSPAMSGRRVTVPANDRVEVRIPVTTATAGTARFQVAAVSDRWSDATEVVLPVWTPATTEAFSTYGEIDQGAISQPVKAPSGVVKEFGGLEIEASSTQLQQLTDAFLYLQNYPYECSEQLSSRILSIAALRDVLHAFNANGLPSQATIEASVIRDIKRLEGMQNEDGGFGFWKRGDESWPFLSIHVAHALGRARQKGFAVPEKMYERSLDYVRNIEFRIPSRYGVDAKRALMAYALYVRAQMGERDTRGARKLLSTLRMENLSLETIGWLLFVLSGDEASRNEVERLRLNLRNRVTETAGTAHFVSSYKDDDHLLLNSDRRADAVVLEALIADQPANDLIPKIVRGLLGHRTQGRWSSTQENVFVLLALDRYFKTYEKVTPDFVARVWLGNAYAGEQEFKGRSVDRQRVNVPMRYLADGESVRNLVISKGGDGRLYYRLAMSYAPSNLNLSSADYGFAVERTYETIDQPEDVQRGADGSWRIKAGARVRVRVTMAAPTRRYHVALVDYLPAGFESLNPELATTEPIPEDKKQEANSIFIGSAHGSNWWLWRRTWFDHQNLRDERSEAFTSLLWGGVYNYSYVARATTPGVFVVPPAKAEEMYHPETFGRSKSDRVLIQ